MTAQHVIMILSLIAQLLGCVGLGGLALTLARDVDEMSNTTVSPQARARANLRVHPAHRGDHHHGR